MPATLVVMCSRCGGLLLAKDEQKTRTCPYCGSQVVLTKVKRVAIANSAYEAAEILKKLKKDPSQVQTQFRRLS